MLFLSDRKGIRPVKNGGVMVWIPVCGEVQICICPSPRLPADATATDSLLLQQNTDWFWYWLTRVIPDKGVCVYVCVGTMVRDDRATWKSGYFEKMIVCISFCFNFECSVHSVIFVHCLSRLCIVWVCYMLLRSTSGTGASLARSCTLSLWACDVTEVQQWLTLFSQKCLSHWHVIAEYLLLVASLSVRPLMYSRLINWACCHYKWSLCLIDGHESGHAFYTDYYCDLESYWNVVRKSQLVDLYVFLVSTARN